MTVSMQFARTGLVLAALSLTPVACANGDQAATSSQSTTASAEAADLGVLELTTLVLHSYPHDPEAFTQGLLWSEGKVYESTGLWGQSSVRRVDLTTGAVELRIDLAPTLFGEGLARIGEELVQLTWQNGRAMRYALDSLVLLSEQPYAGEGWGLCFDGNDLWRSDGTATLTIHDPSTFKERRQVAVSLRGRAVSLLNELECAEGWVYANVLESDEIMRIHPATGQVMAVIDASGLASRHDAGGRRGPLNGIAYRPETGTFLLTGKRWNAVFEVVFEEAGDGDG
jgi:glutaminyl-peptide cyclotransferase